MFESGVVVEVVLVGAEAEGVAGGDVRGEIVDVECLFRDEGVFVDGVLVDFWVGLDGIYLEGEDGTLENGEFWELLEDLRAVDGVGVGEEDEAVALRGEAAGGVPHGKNRGEDVLPSTVELFWGSGAFHGLQCPVCIIAHGDEPCFECVLFLYDLGKCGGGISMCGWKKGGE